MLDADPEQILPPWRWSPRHWFALAGFAILAFVLLRRAPEPATVEPMPTAAAKKPARSAVSKRAAAARRRRAEDKADYALAAKRVAKIEETGGKFYTAEEAKRALGL